MRRWIRFLLLALTVGYGPPASGGSPGASAPSPPRARMEPQRLEMHGHARVDEYYWLNRRNDPEVLAYLEAENAYTEAVMAPVRDLRERLFREIVGRIPRADATVPYRMRDAASRDGYYYTRYEGDGEYPIYCRKRGGLAAPEEILLDADRLGAGKAYFHVAGASISSQGDFFAFAVDTVGRRFYTIRVRDLATGELLPDAIPDVTRNLVWAEDGRTLFYTKQEPVTLRWYRVYRHTVGQPASSDVLVYEEPDSTFEVSVRKTASREFILIRSEQTLSSEVRYLRAARPQEAPRVLEPRRRNHEYEADHIGNTFVIRTNDGARNFRVVEAPDSSPSRDSWREIVPAREDVFLEQVAVFRERLVTLERRKGLPELRIRSREGHPLGTVDFGEPTYVAALGDNEETDTDTLRFVYESMTTPPSVFDYVMSTGEKILRKRDEVLGGYDPSDYRTDRLWATARDGTRVPISLVYRKDLRRHRGNPLLLYGYGSYGYSSDAEFYLPVIPLLDRGFIYAIAHVRGGQELGRRWYEDGKLFQKRNTFTDFIDCAKYLVRKRYAHPEQLFAQGGSAGGLLVGAVSNMHPDLFTGIVAEVPFVDVVTTMLDSSIPLTTSEYDEWGDPNRAADYEYMLSYSPYDQVRARDYPHLLVTAGLHDSQVQYFEPAKWVARLRRLKTDDRRLLFWTNMEAGHSGAAGRFERHRETALLWAFLLDLARIRD